MSKHAAKRKLHKEQKMAPTTQLLDDGAHLTSSMAVLVITVIVIIALWLR